MTNTSLAQSYLTKARARLRILPVLAEEQAWSDVIREAQEIVELALKGMLRHIGIEPSAIFWSILFGVPADDVAALRDER